MCLMKRTIISGTDMISAAERVAHIEQIKPEICTLDCGSMNYATTAYVATMNMLRETAKRIQAMAGSRRNNVSGWPWPDRPEWKDWHPGNWEGYSGWWLQCAYRTSHSGTFWLFIQFQFKGIYSRPEITQLHIIKTCRDIELRFPAFFISILLYLICWSYLI